MAATLLVLGWIFRIMELDADKSKKLLLGNIGLCEMSEREVTRSDYSWST